MEKFEEKVAALPAMDLGEMLSRFVIGQAKDLQVDGSGRILIPPTEAMPSLRKAEAGWSYPASRNRVRGKLERRAGKITETSEHAFDGRTCRKR